MSRFSFIAGPCVEYSRGSASLRTGRLARQLQKSSDRRGSQPRSGESTLKACRRSAGGKRRKARRHRFAIAISNRPRQGVAEECVEHYEPRRCTLRGTQRIPNQILHFAGLTPSSRYRHIRRMRPWKALSFASPSSTWSSKLSAMRTHLSRSRSSKTSLV
jgi:hypothetical protein